jgi:translation initiation factor IF-3
LIKEYKSYNQKDRTRINNAIRAKELRVVGADGENLGLLTLEAALAEAEKVNLDLIEISPNAVPPVAKIMDFGQYRYETKRKASEHDQALKAKRAAEWLNEGHRVKVDLFLSGRYKYMEPGFLKERLERFLKIIPAEYKLAEEVKKSPKGYMTTIERVGKAVKGPKLITTTEPIQDNVEKSEVTSEPVSKSKKKSLDELLDSGMI